MNVNTKSLLLLLVTLCLSTSAKANIFGANTTVNAGGETLTLDLTIDTDNDLVTITMTGPDNLFFAFGFGGTSMNGTYAIIMEGNGNVMERNLGFHNQGSLLTSSFATISNTTSGGTRTVTVTRAINGLNGSYYTFPTTAATINFIYSRGNGAATLSYHGFSNKGVSSISTVLPVNLIDFETSVKEKTVTLDWSTAQEVNNKQFDVLRSTDSRNWEVIGSIEGAGNSQITNEYSFEDAKPNPGINYYRLKQIDFNGEFEYSEIRGVEIAPENQNDAIRVFPTVTTSELTIKTELPFEGKARVQIFSAGLQTVKDVFWESETSQFALDVKDLAKGYYFVIIKHKNWQSTHRFVKE